MRVDGHARMNETFVSYETREDALVVGVHGHWLFEHVTELEAASEDIAHHADRHVVFKCDGLRDIDLAGAWVLYDRSQQLSEIGVTSEFEGFREGHFKFLRHIIDAHAVREFAHELDTPPPPHPVRHFLEHLGGASVDLVEDMGQAARSLGDGVARPSRMMLAETMRQVYFTGVQAIPVVMLISLLIGIVLAYQGATQLERFGAKIFVVDMVSIAVLREMAGLLAAIMVAGRSGSAFAAALGTMKLNEEVDAMRVLGLNPNQLLVMPRVLGLLIALPALTLFADLAGLAGGALITVGALDVSSVQFIERVSSSTGMDDFIAGLIKTPFFAVLIAVVSTLRGMQVRQSAEELGKRTTQAVVESIFLIICADAFFTTIFTRVGL